MKKTTKILLLALTLSVVGFLITMVTSREKDTANTDTQKHQLLVSILPQKQIVERIAGTTNFAVDVLIPPGSSPETYDPTTQEMQKVSQAEMYFRIGKLPFEEVNLSTFTEINPNMVVVDTSINNTFRELEAHSHADEETHAEEDTHEGEEFHDEEISDHSDDEETYQEDESQIDPHVWLAPRMVSEQAEVIYTQLVANYPEYTESFTANFEQLQSDLTALDQELSVAFAPIEGKTMLVYHPAFGYLARDYGFNQEYIEIEGKEPSISDLQKIIVEAKNDGVRVIFVQKQFSTDSAQAIADNINGVVVEVDPLAADYFGNMRTIAQTISGTLIQ